MRFPEHGLQQVYGLADGVTNNGLETHKIMTVPVPQCSPLYPAPKGL